MNNITQIIHNLLFRTPRSVGCDPKLYTRREYLKSLSIDCLTEKQLSDLSEAARVMAKDMLGSYPTHAREYKLPLRVWEKAYNIVMK